jgi:hypothetical protein
VWDQEAAQVIAARFLPFYCRIYQHASWARRALRLVHKTGLRDARRNGSSGSGLGAVLILIAYAAAQFGVLNQRSRN